MSVSPSVQTIRRKRKVQIPMGRPGERETMSEHDEDDDSYEEEIYESRSGRSGPSAYSGGGAAGRRSGRGDRLGGRRDRDRERSGSRERSLSPRSDRHSVSSNLPPRPAKVTLIKSRKNEGEHGRFDPASRCRPIALSLPVITVLFLTWHNKLPAGLSQLN